jgi:hypothetical protein
LPRDSGLVGEAYRTSQTRVILDVRDYPGQPFAPIRSELAIPIRRGLETLGVVIVGSKQLHHYTGDHARWDEFLAEQGAFALTAVDLASQRLSDQQQRSPLVSGDTHRVFVSHSHLDDDFTARLVADLRAAGAQVWVDMADIKHGSFIERINEALDVSDWLVLVLTNAALQSPAVRMEVNAAINRSLFNRIRGVIPFVAGYYDPLGMPATWDILHRYDGTKDYTDALEALLSAIGLHVSREGGQTT